MFLAGRPEGHLRSAGPEGSPLLVDWPGQSSVRSVSSVREDPQLPVEEP